MRSWAQWTAKKVLLTAGFAAASAGLPGMAFAVGIPGTDASGASASDTSTTSGNGSVGSGNQVNAPVTAPVDVCGNAVAILGDLTAGCEGAVSAGGPAGQQSSAYPAPDRGGRQVPERNTQSSVILPVLPGLPSLPVTSALAGLPSPPSPSSLAVAGALPGGVHLPGDGISTGTFKPQGTGEHVAQASGLQGSGPKPATQRATGRTATGSKAAALKALKLRGARPAGVTIKALDKNGAVSNSIGSATSGSSGLAALGTLPLVSSLPLLTELARLPALTASPGGPVLMPASTLTAADAPGMGRTSFYTLVIGALMVVASALKIGGLRARARRS